jgi:hypothetical protein
MSPNSLLVFLAIGLPLTLPIIAQMPPTTPNDAVRVTVTLNADGSRTIYQFDNAKHEAIATTTDANGKPRGKIVYQIGDTGRFVSGIVFGPDERFCSKAYTNMMRPAGSKKRHTSEKTTLSSTRLSTSTIQRGNRSATQFSIRLASYSRA